MKNNKEISFQQKINTKLMDPYRLQVLALTVMIVVAFFIALVSYRDVERQYRETVNAQAAQLNDAADEIDFMLKSSKDQLQILVDIMARPYQYQEQEFDILEDAAIMPDTERFHLVFKKGAGTASISGVGNPTEFNLEKREHLLDMMALTPFFKIVHEQIQNIQWLYFVSKEEAILLYPETTVEDYVFDYSTMQQDFYKLALPERNPERRVMATKVYEDEAGAGLMVTLSQPVYRGQDFLGAMALDITLKEIEQILEKHGLDQGTYFLKDEFGNVMVVQGSQSLTDKEQSAFSGRRDVMMMRTHLKALPWELESIRSKNVVYFKMFINLLGMIGVLIVLIPFSVILTRQIYLSAEIYNNQLRFEQVVDQSTQLMVMLDKNGRMLYVNHASAKLIGESHQALIGKAFEEGAWWSWSDELKQFIKDAVLRCNLGESVKRDVVHYNQKGEPINVEFTLNPIYTAKGEIEYLMATGNEVTDRIKLKESMEKLSKMDMLTNVSNRRGATEFLEAEIGRSVRQNLPLCILLGDIDFFKRVNDTFGHNVGDQVLVKICDVMKSHIRDYDHVGRWGGEEFIIILQGTSNESAMQTAKRICRTIMETDFFGLSTRLSFPVTMTFGVSEYRQDMDINDFIKLADDGLYFGKRNGRNQVVALKPNNVVSVERP